MKTRLCVVVLCAGMIAGIGVAKQPNAGSLGPPEDFLVTQNDDSIFFSWLPVEQAEKYSVDVEATIIWGDGEVRGEVPFERDFGTQDEIGEVYMRSGRVVLEIPKTAMTRLVLAALEDADVDRAAVIGFLLDGEAKVKALNPGKGKGPQNHPFSNTDDLEFRWVR